MDSLIYRQNRCLNFLIANNTINKYDVSHLHIRIQNINFSQDTPNIHSHVNYWVPFYTQNKNAFLRIMNY